MEAVEANGRLQVRVEGTRAENAATSGGPGLVTMPEEEAEQEGDEPDQEEGSEETIEDLFEGNQPEIESGERTDGDHIDDASRGNDDGEEPNDGDDPVGGEGSVGPDGGEEDEDAEGPDDGEGEDDAGEAATDDDAESDGEVVGDSLDDEAEPFDDQDEEVLDDGAGGSGIDEELIAVDDRSKPPKVVGGGTGTAGGYLTTGIDALDDHLGGGIPPGRILSFVATADTQSELLVKHLAAQHDCLYLSTLRPKWEVEEEVTDYVQKSAASTGGTSVHIEQLTPDSPLDSARRHVEELDGRTIVVIDSANELEALEKDRYVYFVDEVKRTLWETGSVGLFYCVEEERPPVGRAVTLRRADLIWQLRPTVEPDGLHHQLLISKFRGGRALTEPLELSLTDEVGVETDPEGS